MKRSKPRPPPPKDLKMSNEPQTPDQENTSADIPEDVFPEELPVRQDAIVEEPLTAEEETPEPEEPTIQQRVHLDESVLLDQEWDDDIPHMAMPSATSADLQRKLGKVPNISLTGDPKSRDWASTLNEGQDMVTMGDVFVDSLSREDADYHQSIQSGGSKLQAAAPRIRNLENETLRGERAIIHITRQLNIGTTFQIPCWHSGLWVTLKPPTEIELIDLNRAMIASKIRLGYSTYGLAYSNVTSYTVDHLLTFIFNHIYTTTVKNEELPIEKLGDTILMQDLYTLIWGMACTMYPKGFQFRRGCIDNPEKCNHVTEEVLNLSKLQWTDASRLTEWQKAHMAQRKPLERDMSSVKKYRDEMISMKNSRVLISSDKADVPVYINFRSPTLNQYVSEGVSWISNIIESINKSITETEEEVDRNLIVQRHGQASSLRQYVHWVDSIEMGSNTIDEVETIRSVLNIMSSDDYLRDKFLEEVVNYINNTTMSVIGIPSYDCPACGKPQVIEQASQGFHNIVPIDVIQYFFSLTTQRIRRIANR